MSKNISSTGLVITITASQSFPDVPIVITQFSDDADALDFADHTAGAGAMGLNGDGLYWSTPNSITVDINVIPGSDDDAKLASLYALNRIGENKTSAADTITMTGTYPGRPPITLTEGWITTGSPAQSAASTGRQKTKKYGYGFPNLTGS